jgi:hypothetical protein
MNHQIRNSSHNHPRAVAAPIPAKDEPPTEKNDPSSTA